MTREQIINFIQQNSVHNYFTGGVFQSDIKEIESKLQVKLPESYKWFLLNYGSGGVFGVDILGYGKSSIPAVVSDTERFRKLGLPNEYVVIENYDEFVYCLDTTSKLSNNECPIICWDIIAGFNGERADNFYEFLLERLFEAKENWDEDL